MDFFTLVRSRYSVRKFEKQRLEKDVIDKILAAGHVAPTGCNNQPQRILVLNTDKDIEKLKGCTKCHFDAPSAMLVCYDKNEAWTRRYDGKDCGVCDATIVTTHMMLAAWCLGIGTCWVMHFDPFKMAEAFNIPQNIKPVALLLMGRPAPEAKPMALHDEFRPIEETVRYGSF